MRRFILSRHLLFLARRTNHKTGCMNEPQDGMHAPAPPPQPPAPDANEAASASPLLALPEELQLKIAGALSEWQDRAAFCLASPRLGIKAIRTIETHKDPLLAIALALWHRRASAVLDERCFRRYAADDQASVEGCGWLTAAAVRHGVGIGFQVSLSAFANAVANESVSTWRLVKGTWCLTNGTWHLTKGVWAGRLTRARSASLLQPLPPGQPPPPTFPPPKSSVLLRLAPVRGPDTGVLHYEGGEGAERLVRIVRADGYVAHYEGQRGAERLVRAEGQDGSVGHYDGEGGAERLVRAEGQDGSVGHYEGERGAERLVRAEHLDGSVAHHEGERGAERIVRIEFTRVLGDHVQHYQQPG